MSQAPRVCNGLVQETVDSRHSCDYRAEASGPGLISRDERK